MRGPGEILLLSCYELGHQPLSLAFPLAFLTQAGLSPVAVDTTVESLPDDALRCARLVAISVPMHTALRLGAQVAARVRRTNPAAHICFYGLYAHLNAEYLLQTLADSVIGGEYEQALVNLAESLAANRGAEVEGVRTQRREAAPILKRLPFPLPARDRLPGLPRYARLQMEGELRLAGYVEASRGCLHTCRHCPITPVYRGRFFVIPKEIVLEDIRRQVRQGAQHITFGDPDFLNGPGHALRIVRTMHREFPNLTFDATIKIEHILEFRSLFPELKELGCVFVLSAVESVNDAVLERLDKGHTRADVVQALAILADAGIPLRASLLPFTPWSTLDDYVGLLDFVEGHGLVDHVDPVQYSIRLLIPPGSALLDQPENAPWLGRLDAASFTYEWTHPDPRMDRLQREVAALVEAASAAGENPAVTFAAIKGLAHAIRGTTPKMETFPDRSQVTTNPLDELLRALPFDKLGARRPPPRLTESWFC